MKKILLFLLIMLLQGLVEGNNPDTSPSVLVINSYNSEFIWTENTVRGFKTRILKAFPGTLIFTEFADTKRFPDYENMNYFSEFLRKKYRSRIPDIIIATDNNALSISLSLIRSEPFKDRRIVFCGINNCNDFRNYDKNIASGVCETVDIKGNIKLIHKILPSYKKIILITENSETGQIYRDQAEPLKNSAADIVKSFEIYKVISVQDTIKKVKNTSPDTAILITPVSRYNSRETLSFIKSTELICQNTNSPVFGTHDFMLNKGIAGGILASGEAQGKKAAEQCIKILSGTPLSQIKLLIKSPDRAMFDTKILKKFSVSESILPYKSILINSKPSEFYTKILIAASGIIVLLSLALSVLLYNIRKRQKAEKELIDIKLDLESRIEAKTLDLEIINQTIKDELAEKRRFEKQLTQQILLSETLFDAMPGIICIVETDTENSLYKIIKNNKALIRESGFSSKELHKIDPRILIPEENNTDFRDALEIVGKKGAHTFESQIRTKDNVKKPFLVRITNFIHKEKPSVIMTGINISARKRMELSMLKSGKLELGLLMAEGIAHDFNNILTVINGYFQILQDKSSDNSQNKIFSKISDSIEKAAKLSDKLITLSLSTGFIPSEINLFQILKKIISEFREKFPERDFKSDLSSGMPDIYGDSANISTSVRNILNNAVEATEKNGKINIDSEISDFNSENEFHINPGHYLVIRISDDGRGISHDIASKVYDPYFSTKPDTTDKGIGFGLTFCHSVMIRHKGYIDIQSEPENGTSVRLFFPLDLIKETNPSLNRTNGFRRN